MQDVEDPDLGKTLLGERDGTAARVAAAGCVTLLGVSLVYAFDAVADRLFDAGHRAEAAGIIAIITAIGVMIGFSWERAFDRASEDLWARIGQRVANEVDDVFGFHKPNCAASFGWIFGTG